MPTPPIKSSPSTPIQDYVEYPNTAKTDISPDKPNAKEKKGQPRPFSLDAKRSRRSFDLLQQRVQNKSPTSAGTSTIVGEQKLSQYPEAKSVQQPNPPATNALQRRNTAHPNPAWTANGQYDCLGERVPEVTFKNLASVMEQRANFRQGKGPVASVAQKLGLTRTLALPTHLAMVLQLAFKDPELLNIAKMGLRIAMENPETNGVPPEGFKPLYDLLEKWGYNRQGVLVDQEKFDARIRFIEARGEAIAAFKQFSSDVAAKLPAGSKNTSGYTVNADNSDDSSLLSLLVTYFTQFPKPKDKEAAAGMAR